MKYVNINKNRKPTIKKDSSKGAKVRNTALVTLFAFGTLIAVGIFLTKVNIFNPISIVASISQVEVQKTDGRTNILVLGADNSAKLTDTILVASIDVKKQEMVLISIPRDLWVQGPTGSYSKINAVYGNGEIEHMKYVVEDVIGIPIHYYGVIDFEIFKEIIDTVGGVTVDVERFFVDPFYPVEGREDDLCGVDPEEVDIEEELEKVGEYELFPCRYETVVFEQGPQFMDSDKALRYVRSRKGNNDEGTDFARAARQQNLILAIKDKVLTLETLLNPIKLKELHSIYANRVDTNLTLADINNFYALSQQTNLTTFHTIVLDDRSSPEEGGLLYAPNDTRLYQGQYVLIPRLGNYTQIHAYIHRYLFGN